MHSTILIFFSFIFFFYVFVYLFIYLWLCWVFVSVRGLSLVVASGGHSSSRCAGLSLSWPLLLRAEHRLQMRRLSSCDSRAQLLHGMWDLPRPGLEPMSPALAGRFSTTAPPGKPFSFIFVMFLLSSKYFLLFLLISSLCGVFLKYVIWFPNIWIFPHIFSY